MRPTRIKGILLMKDFTRRKKSLLALVLFVAPCSVLAQNTIGRVDSTACELEEDWIVEVYEDENGNEAVSDTIWLGNLDAIPQVTQYELKKCDQVNICANNPKYAIVVKNGKCGLYDNNLHVNVTVIAFDKLNFLQKNVLGNGNVTSLFFVVEGHKRGKLSVDEATNNIVYVWTEDE